MDHSARQLELLGEWPAGSESGPDGSVLADRRSRPSAGLEASPASPARPSTPAGVTKPAADRTALTKPSTVRQRNFPRLAVSPDEAAEMLGVSRDYFDEHVIDELRVVRRGRRILIALAELERWLDRASMRATVGRSS
ncbi:MAG: helix-turn-helix domain-containing protein [Actinobacteria bacterium]|nr:helix-turn-helix domain-containing protein [Actinomycetota bacterium]